MYTPMITNRYSDGSVGVLYSTVCGYLQGYRYQLKLVIVVEVGLMHVLCKTTFPCKVDILQG